MFLILLGIAMSASAAGAFRQGRHARHSIRTLDGVGHVGVVSRDAESHVPGLSLSLLGCGLALASLGALLPLPVFIGHQALCFIRGEEHFLEGIFGEEIPRPESARAALGLATRMPEPQIFARTSHSVEVIAWANFGVLGRKLCPSEAEGRSDDAMSRACLKLLCCLIGALLLKNGCAWMCYNPTRSP